MCASKSEEQVQAVKILRLQVGMWKKKLLQMMEFLFPNSGKVKI